MKKRETRKTALNRGRTDRITLTHDLDPQSPTSYGDDLLMYKISKPTVSRFRRQSGNNWSEGWGDCITSHANAVGKNRTRSVTSSVSQRWLPSSNSICKTKKTALGPTAFACPPTTLTSNPLQAMAMTYSHVQKLNVHDQSVLKIEWKETDGQKDRRTEAITLPPTLMQSVIMRPVNRNAKQIRPKQAQKSQPVRKSLPEQTTVGLLKGYMQSLHV